MREENISKMNFKELRTEVQLLRDELAIFKRRYEDSIYDLDSDNFGKSYTVEQNRMKAQIKINADAIETKVSDTDLESSLEKYSTITQTASMIQGVVSKGVNLKNAVKAESISKMTDPSKIYVIQDKDAETGNVTSETYYYYNDLLGDWEVLSGDSIYTLFEQTEDGFKLRGNVLIDGGAVKWSTDNSPVKAMYSANNTDWHTEYEDGDTYMKLSFDGGTTYNTPVKITGKDGEDGKNANLPSYIESTYIDFSKVESPQIIGNFVLGNEIRGGAYCDGECKGKLTLNTTTKGGASYPDLTYSRYDGQELFKIYDNLDDTASIYVFGHSIGYGSANAFYPSGEWNFMNATLTNLKVKFG